MLLFVPLLATLAAPADADQIRAALKTTPAAAVAPAAAGAGPDAGEHGPVPAPVLPSGYSMYAVQVGVTPSAKRATFIADPSLGPRVTVAFAFWVLQGFDRVIVIDTGFLDRRYLRTWNVHSYRDPVAGLAALDLTPADVTDVVITHHHWDHVGGLECFADATIWIDSRALAKVRESSAAGIVATLSTAEKAGRLRRTTSLQEVAPHVVVVHTGMHAPGFQYVVASNPDGLWVFASDIAPLRANLERDSPTGLTSDVRGTLATMATMRTLVRGNLEHIVTGHDPGGFDLGGIRRLSP